jgi:hypothetical protein
MSPIPDDVILESKKDKVLDAKDYTAYELFQELADNLALNDLHQTLRLCPCVPGSLCEQGRDCPCGFLPGNVASCNMMEAKWFIEHNFKMHYFFDPRSVKTLLLRRKCMQLFQEMIRNHPRDDHTWFGIFKSQVFCLAEYSGPQTTCWWEFIRDMSSDHVETVHDFLAQELRKGKGQSCPFKIIADNSNTNKVETKPVSIHPTSVAQETETFDALKAFQSISKNLTDVQLRDAADLSISPKTYGRLTPRETLMYLIEHNLHANRVHPSFISWLKKPFESPKVEPKPIATVDISTTTTTTTKTPTLYDRVIDALCAHHIAEVEKKIELEMLQKKHSSISYSIEPGAISEYVATHIKTASGGRFDVTQHPSYIYIHISKGKGTCRPL